MGSRRRISEFLSLIVVTAAVGGCTSEAVPPSLSQGTAPTVVASTSTTMSSRVSGPGADGTYTTVLAAADAFESCWAEREPHEYLLAGQAWSFGVGPPELSHVIDGVAQPTDDVPGTTASTRARTGETERGERGPTVEDAFVRIAVLADQEPDGLSVVFDRTLCHPRTISVDLEMDAVDDEITFEYTVIPTGNHEVALVPVVSATVAGRSYRVELDDGTTFIGDPFVWEACRDQVVPPCGALIVMNDGGEVVHSVAAVPDESTGWWRLPTFGAITRGDDRLVLWEGAAVELDAAFGPLANGEETMCQSFVAGETVGAELIIDPSTLQLVGYTCW